MDYNHITNFLNKFKNIVFQGQKDNRTIAEVITKHISFPIKEDMIKIKGSTIYINGSPILKTEILIHKAGILSDLSSMISGRRFTDIN